MYEHHSRNYPHILSFSLSIYLQAQETLLKFTRERWTFGDDPDGSTSHFYALQGRNEGDNTSYGSTCSGSVEMGWKSPACDGMMEPSSWTVSINNNRFDPFGMKGQEYSNGEPTMVLQSIQYGASLPASWSLANLLSCRGGRTPGRRFIP